MLKRLSIAHTEKDLGTLSVDVRDVESVLQSQDHDSKLQVEGVAGI